jgi:hypothetical protein
VADDSLQVACSAAPPVGYLLAYQYERGFLSFFDVPTTLIDVSLSLIANATTSLILWICGWLFIVFMLRSFLRGPRALSFALRKVVDYAAILIPLYALIPTRHPSVILAFLGGSALLVAFADGLNKWNGPWPRWAPSWLRDKPATRENGPAKSEEPSLAEKVLVIPLVVVGVPCVLAFFLGYFSASREREHFVASENGRTKVLVRRYGDLAIFAPLGTDNQSLTGETNVVRLPESPMFSVKLQVLAQLKPAHNRWQVVLPEPGAAASATASASERPSPPSDAAVRSK